MSIRGCSKTTSTYKKEVHRALDSQRVSRNREFFKLSVEEAIAKIRSVTNRSEKSEEIFYVKDEEIQKIEAKIKEEKLKKYRAQQNKLKLHELLLGENEKIFS